jgi:transposase
MTLPADLARLSSQEKDALIQALFARLGELEQRIERLEAENAALRAENAALRAENAELRAKLELPAKTPDNSSLPPSRGQKGSGSATAKVKRKPHSGAHRPLHPQPTSRRDCWASQCQHCGSDVSGMVQVVCEAYDRIEIPKIEPEVMRVSLYGGTCPCCARRFKAPPPPGLEPGSPFGPNLRAVVLYLRAVQGLPLERLSHVLRDLFGLAISEGALVNILSASREAFAAQTQAIQQHLKSGTVLESDETGIRVGKANWWLWVFHHADSAVFVIDQHRSKAVVRAFLGEHRPDYWVSDRYGAQMGWAQKEQQVCLAHLIRDVRYAIEAGDTVLAPALKGLLKRACAIGRRRPDLADTTLKQYAADLEKRLDAVMDCTPTAPAGLKLHRLIKKIRRHLFVFVTNRALPPTNNGSERALRPCAVYRKVTNGFRSKWGAALYANIRSLVETARRRAIRAIDAIRLTLQRLPLATPT